MSTALLNARRRFALPMFAPILNNLVVIGVLLAFPHVASDLSLERLASEHSALLFLGLGTTAGVAAMALPQIAAVLRQARGRLRLSWDSHHAAVRTVLRLSPWTFGFAVANQLAYWVVLLLANRRSGDLSAYQSAYQYFFLLPHGIIAVSLMSALQPDLAEHWSLGRVEEFRARLATGLRSLLAVLVPAAIGYITLGEPIVRLLIGHGAMSEADVRIVADVLALMARGPARVQRLPPAHARLPGHADARQVFFLYLIENAVNVALALALYPSMGVRGLAVAFILAYTAGTATALFAVRRRIGGIEGRALAAAAGRVVAASAVMAAVTLLCGRHVGAADGPGLVLRVTVGVVAGVSVYVAVARALGEGELAALLRIGRGKRQPG